MRHFTPINPLILKFWSYNISITGTLIEVRRTILPIHFMFLQGFDDIWNTLETYLKINLVRVILGLRIYEHKFFRASIRFFFFVKIVFKWKKLMHKNLRLWEKKCNIYHILRHLKVIYRHAQSHPLTIKETKSKPKRWNFLKETNLDNNRNHVGVHHYVDGGLIIIR